MLDKDLAALYGVETRVLNQAVKRHKKRFPEDFMFQLSKSEYVLKYLFLLILEGEMICNLLSISKSFGYIVEQEINIESLNLNERKSFLKGTPMLGFLGTFSVNFEIPDYWGFGKSVSRGFGTIKRIHN